MLRWSQVCFTGLLKQCLVEIQTHNDDNNIAEMMTTRPKNKRHNQTQLWGAQPAACSFSVQRRGGSPRTPNCRISDPRGGDLVLLRGKYASTSDCIAYQHMRTRAHLHKHAPKISTFSRTALWAMRFRSRCEIRKASLGTFAGYFPWNGWQAASLGDFCCGS